MPFELDAVDVVLAPLPPDELWVCVWVWAAGWLEEPELDELEPHAATPRAASTRRAAAKRRVDLVMVAYISRSFGVRPGSIPVTTYDAVSGRLVPGR